MTYVDRIRKEKLNIFHIQKELREMIESKDWTSKFCHNENDKMCTYTESLSALKRKVHLSEVGYVSSVFSEDLALGLINNCLAENIAHIANFLLIDDSSIELMGMTDSEIGYIVKKYKTIEESSYVILSIRKNDKPCNNHSGFFVEYIYPVKLS
ncbi:MAG: hypothetical protein U0L11_07230 [Acutalibacteraceae bacterium]|nr:hypothetical protein [Acutalibacteraceae bacterium]